MASQFHRDFAQRERELQAELDRIQVQQRAAVRYLVGACVVFWVLLFWLTL